MLAPFDNPKYLLKFLATMVYIYMILPHSISTRGNQVKLTLFHGTQVNNPLDSSSFC